MDQLRAHLLLALAVLLGSAVPFVPTGEMVSGASAIAVHSRLNDAVIFGICFVASVLGDLIMLAEARLLAPALSAWLSRQKIGERVATAQRALSRNVFSTVITGRLIPGGRTPVIAALGLSRIRIRRFLAADLIGCALWAAVYVTLGSVGGRIAHHRVWAMIVAIAFAVSIGMAVQQLTRFVSWRRTRQGSETTESGAEENLHAGS